MSSDNNKAVKSDLKLQINKGIFKAKYKINALKKTERELKALNERRLLFAVSYNDTDFVKNMLELGVNANTSDTQLRSALHIASSRGYIDIVKLLLQYGGDPNKRDIIQNTPLHLAACTSNLQIITLLINSGADLRSLDLHGRNPLQLAESKLQMLQKSWKNGAIEMNHLGSQLKEIVDVMISLWKHKESTTWGHHRDNVDDLELMKLSINSGPAEQVDDQMNKLLSELQQFTIK